MRVERSSLDQVKARFAQNKKKAEEKQKSYDFDQRITDLKEEEERLREYRRDKRKEKKNRKRGGGATQEEEGGGMDDMAAIMGFGGFGGTKKN